MIKTLFIIVLGAVVLMGCSSTPKVSYSPKALKYHNYCSNSAYQESKDNQIEPQTPFEGLAAVIVERQHRKAIYHNCMKQFN